MQVKDITRVRLTSGRTAKDQGNLTVGDRLFGQIVVDHQGVSSAIPEVLSDGRSGERGEILHGCRVGGGRAYDNRIVHGAFLLQGVHQGRYRGTLLPDRHVNTVNRVPCLVVATLVDDGIDSDRGLSRLPVADDQLTLPPPDRDHSVYGLDTGLQRLVYRLTEDHTRSLTLKRHLASLAKDLAFPVDRVSQRIDHTPDHPLADIDRGDTARAFYGVALLDLVGRT